MARAGTSAGAAVVGVLAGQVVPVIERPGPVQVHGGELLVGHALVVAGGRQGGRLSQEGLGQRRARGGRPWPQMRDQSAESSGASISKWRRKALPIATATRIRTTVKGSHLLPWCAACSAPRALAVCGSHARRACGGRSSAPTART